MKSKSFVIIVLLLLTLMIYLFVSAPPPLEDDKKVGIKIPINLAFQIVEAENDGIRAIWTKEIVGEGNKQGLTFGEDWREKNVEAGPLPALFLREIAKNLERKPLRLSLFLGSEFPINDANLFSGIQLEKFKNIKSTSQPEFFYSEDIGLYSAMFTDIASVDACIRCHNEHEQTPKKDWKLNDIMGATTWMYPEKEVNLAELLQMIMTLRQAFTETYKAYIKKSETFTKQVEIGDKWPRDGYFLPSVEVFMAKVNHQNAKQTLNAILQASLAASTENELTIKTEQVDDS